MIIHTYEDIYIVIKNSSGQVVKIYPNTEYYEAVKECLRLQQETNSEHRYETVILKGGKEVKLL